MKVPKSFLVYNIMYGGTARKTTKATFKPHFMYKGKDVKRANTQAEHLRLTRLGYTHTKPK
jgi:hypothetical protein